VLAGAPDEAISGTATPLQGGCANVHEGVGHRSLNKEWRFMPCRRDANRKQTEKDVNRFWGASASNKAAAPQSISDN
jgi:hypothetical protein